MTLSNTIILRAVITRNYQPVNPTCRIDRSRHGVLVDLGSPRARASHPPLRILRRLVRALDSRSHRLTRDSLFVNVTRSDFGLALDPNSFLVHALLKISPGIKTVTINSHIQPNRQVRFRLHSTHASTRSLSGLLNGCRQSRAKSTPTKTLVFTYTNQKRNLCRRTGFSSGLFRHCLKPLPLDKFFYNNRVNPINGAAFLRNFASIFKVYHRP